ncbi:MAG: lamin tail domain-containing protein [Herpetosiphonaceae bacterium]|nr:lamin tail domain-containing protein [Herpetosiphonaceae bacterium]
MKVRHTPQSAPARLIWSIALVCALLAGLALRTSSAAQIDIGSTGSAAAISTSLVISQIYGAGGNVYTNDYIEIFNRGSTTVTMTNWSVQYASATGPTWAATALNGSIAPGQYFLIQEGAGGGGGTPMPTPDASAGIAMSGTVGKVALVNTTTLLTGSNPSGSSVIDLVGYGATANGFEGTGPTPAPSTTNAIFRAGGGCTDTDQNSTDFSTAAPLPRNSSSPVNSCTPAATATPVTPTATPVTPTATQAPGGDNNLLWDQLYHSATSSNPLTELVPGETFAFLEGTGGVIDSSTAPQISMLTDYLDASSASIRYWDGSQENIVAMTRVKSLTAAFRDQPSRTYDLWRATLPAYPNGTTIYYRVIVQDGSATAVLKTANGQYVNPLGQHVRGFIDDPDDYSYTVAAVPTATPVTPTATPVTPTATEVTPTATEVTPSTTPVTPSATPVTPTATEVTPSATPVTPSATPVTPSATPVGVTNVAISNFSFIPNNVTINVGTSVRWTNNDGAAHTSTSNTGVWNSGTLLTGQQFTFTFPTVGVFPYFCAIHPAMTGTVTVIDPNVTATPVTPTATEVTPSATPVTPSVTPVTPSVTPVIPTYRLYLPIVLKSGAATQPAAAPRIKAAAQVVSRNIRPQ